MKITLTTRHLSFLFRFFKNYIFCRKYAETREAQGHHRVAFDSIPNLDKRTVKKYTKVTLLFYSNEILT